MESQQNNIRRNNPFKSGKFNMMKNKISSKHRRGLLNSELNIHIGIMGPSKCGKSSLLKSFISKTFNPKLNEDSILNIHKLVLATDYGPIGLIVTELAINDETTNESISRELIKSMDVIFLCHEMREKDTGYNEEEIKKLIAYIHNILDKKNILLYLVGCKLDQKFESLGNDTTNIYEKVSPYKVTDYGQRIKIFVDRNKIKKFYATSALLNFNISELFEHAIKSACYVEYKKSISENNYQDENIDNQENNNNIFNEQNEEILDENEFMEKCIIF